MLDNQGSASSRSFGSETPSCRWRAPPDLRAAGREPELALSVPVVGALALEKVAVPPRIILPSHPLRRAGSVGSCLRAYALRLTKERAVHAKESSSRIFSGYCLSWPPWPRSPRVWPTLRTRPLPPGKPPLRLPRSRRTPRCGWPAMRRGPNPPRGRARPVREGPGPRRPGRDPMGSRHLGPGGHPPQRAAVRRRANRETTSISPPNASC